VFICVLWELNNMKVSSVLIAAIGGQGGNVLVEWLFLAAGLDQTKMKAQAIALPGLSQRGGGTTFYLEIAHSAKDEAELEKVVFSQHPFPGKVDIIIGQELVELGRVLRGGYAGNRTTVVGSTYRNYTIGEKMPSFEGIYPSEEIERMVYSLAGQAVLLDVPALAQANGLGDLAANAIMFGVLSALPDALPYNLQACEAAIKKYGLAVEMNLKAFAIGRAFVAGVREQESGNRSQGSESREQESGVGEQGTGNREQESGVRSQGSGNREQETATAKSPVLAGTAAKFPSLPVGENRSGADLPKFANFGEIKSTAFPSADGGDQTTPSPIWERASARDETAKPADSKTKKVIIPLQRKEAKAKPDLAKTISEREISLAPKYRSGFRRLAHEVQVEFAPELHFILVEAIYQTVDYQNPAYAERYLNLVREVYRLDNAQKQYSLTQTFAKKLAARMTYEDAVRVATQKIHPHRFERIRKDMGVKDGQLLEVTDYLKPDAAEIYGMFPYFLVAPVLLTTKAVGMGKLLEKFYMEQKPRTNTFSGFMTFKFLTWFKPIRSISHRANHEWKEINRYIRLVKDYATKDYELGCLAAETGKLVKGYGNTRRKLFEAVDAYLNDMLAPLEKWEAKAKDSVAGMDSTYPVTVKAGKLALGLLARDDNGVPRAEAFTKQVLEAAKAKTARAEILAKLDEWARALR
jgi:Pyruvate/2-oxoacid:ferredoxin oxidoreductase gamma subunit